MEERKHKMNIAERILRVPYVWESLRKMGLLKWRQERDYQRLIKAQKEIDARLAEKKKKGEHVNVVFVCHRPQLWTTLKGVYEVLKDDPLFDVKIFAVPQRNKIKGRGFLNEVFQSEGAEEFWAGENCVNGYNYETGEWTDLQTLHPDYVFFQQPYNVARPDCLLSSTVSQYAKILYLTYYVMVDLDSRAEECTPVDFMRDMSFYFAQNEDDKKFMEGRLEKGGPNICQIPVTGHPRLERIREHVNDQCDMWYHDESCKILWLPRWTTNEGACHFFSYGDALKTYCRNHPDIELMFRPHPQAFKEWRSTGELTEEGEKKVREEFSQGNFHLDETRNFYPQMFTSDILISDPSSMIIDYFFTGKPIIYCANHGVNDGIVDVLKPGMYWVNSWDELKNTLDMLRAGQDPLKEIRAECANKYQGTDGIRSTEKIHEILRTDALK